MTKQEFDLKYCGERVAVHCDTEEKAKAFLSLAKSVGYKWNTGGDLEKTTNWCVNKKLTIYALNYIEEGFMVFGSISGYVKDNNYKIIPFELNEPYGYAIEDTPSPMKETFKVGDVVYTKHGYKATILERAWLVMYHDGGGNYFKKESELTKQKPLKEITEKELAEIGYVLKK